MKSELKTKYKEDYRTVSDIVNKFDPFKLIEGGSPNDEYDFLTHKLLSFFYNRKNNQDIKSLVLEELGHEFGKQGLKEMNEAYKTNFLSDIDKLLDKIESYIGTKHIA